MTFSRKAFFGLLLAGLFVGLVFAPGVMLGKNEASPEKLKELHEQLLPLFTLPGVVYTDVLEDKHRLEVGVTHAGLSPEVKKELKTLKVPSAMVDVVVTQPIVQLATLQDRVRPLDGGLQVAFSQFLCTLGFNGVRAGTEGFVVNSHCTNKQGSVEGTAHYQPLAAEENLIGTEIADPPFFRNSSCPRGKKCRYSDSAYDRRAIGVAADLGLIARTDSVNTGSLTLAGNFRIVSEAPTNAAVGEALNKVGRTTGWSQGTVTRSCANTAVSGTNMVQLCQDWVGANVGAGDSGSPVFKIINAPQQDDVQLHGILWGGTTDGTTFVYSPMANVQRPGELGPVTTCASGFSC